MINYIVDSLASAKGYEQIYALEDLGVVNKWNKERKLSSLWFSSITSQVEMI